MKAYKHIIIWVIIFVVLLPIITFPLSSDNSIYLETGKIIANGGVLYTDSIDLKQPLIYYIFSFIYLIFGYSEISVRIFDIIWQGITVLSLFFVVRKYLSQSTAYLSAFVYSISYTALNYTQTMQCETFAALPLVWLFYFHTSGKNKFINSLIVGMLIGIVTGLKYTLGIVLIAVLLDNLINFKERKNKFIFHQLVLILGFIVAFVLAMSPLLDCRIYEGYTHVYKYMSIYSAHSFFSLEIIRSFLKNTGYFFGERYSMLLTIGVITGIYYYLRNYQSSELRSKVRFLNISYLTIIFLYVSIYIEGKFWDYHISRIYVPLTILSAVGLLIVYNKLKDIYTTKNIYLKSIIILLLFSAFLFSPFPRWLNTVRTAYYFVSDEEKYDGSYLDVVSNEVIPLRIHYKQIAEIINRNINNDSKVIVVSNGYHVINYFLNTDNVSRFRNSQFIFNPLDIKKWKKYFRDEVNNADWMIFQTDDSDEIVMLQDISSWDAFRRNTEIFSYFNKSFNMYDSVGNFYIFRRTKNGNGD
jgi:hypothetical protein